MRLLLILLVLFLQAPVFVTGQHTAIAGKRDHSISHPNDQLSNWLFGSGAATETIYSAKHIASSFKIPEQRIAANGVVSQWSDCFSIYDASKHYAIDAPPSHTPIGRLILFPQHYFW